MDGGLFDGIIGQPRAVAILTHALKRGPGHAYLFCGPRGVGKTRAAYAFAAGLLCPQGGCDSCRACRLARAGLHPDLETIAPEGSYILIEQVRELNADVALRPFEAARRVYIILEAETLTGPKGESANAFLKTLEEPPSHAHFILVTSVPEHLPATIVSRCQRVPFSRIPVEPLARHLGELYGLPEADCRMLARVSQGDLAYVRALVESREAQDSRMRILSWGRELPTSGFVRQQTLVDDMMDLIGQRQTGVADRVQAEWTRELEWAGDARSRARVDGVYGTRMKRGKRAAMMAVVDEILYGLAGWYRDLAAVALGAGEAVHNQDYLEELRDDALPGLIDAYVATVAVAERTRDRFRYNVDARCTLEDMVFSMKEALL